ncbi:unnamed protein product [Meloidogyne enterolobii]|uniref:Uncharacterized protein n=1 Tax=Meloidogyne enterolobii TaxID=390850 RepID=A0ACB0ZMH9_MELEN
MYKNLRSEPQSKRIHFGVHSILSPLKSIHGYASVIDLFITNFLTKFYIKKLWMSLFIVINSSNCF